MKVDVFCNKSDMHVLPVRFT